MALWADIFSGTIVLGIAVLAGWLVVSTWRRTRHLPPRYPLLEQRLGRVLRAMRAKCSRSGSTTSQTSAFVPSPNERRRLAAVPS